jgi:LPXTG-motif cell wall-anchored protein
MGSKRKLGRVLGAVALAGAILAGPLGIGQAHAADVESFSGMGTGYALRVSLDLRPLINTVPALGTVLNTVVGAIPGAKMDTPGVIDQYFIRTTSDANGSVTKARSSLAEGLIDLQSVEATSVGQKVEKAVQTINLPSDSLPLISGQVGALKAAVSKGPDVLGSGLLNKLNVKLPLDSLPTGVVTDLLGQLTDTVDGVTSNLDGVLGGVLGNQATQNSLVSGLTGSITGLTGSLGGGALGNLASGLGISQNQLSNPTAVAGALDGILDVQALVDQLKSVLQDNLLKGTLASLTDLVNNTNALHLLSNGGAAADSVASLAGLDVLGGLVDVSAFNLSSHSEAAGVAGSAKNTSKCSLADVKIGGGALGLSLDGKNIFINGTPVPVVGDLVGTVKGLVDGVLGALGINVSLCDVAQKTAEADGTAAAQRVSALRVDVAPLGLFHLIIDPTVETAVAAQVGTAAVNQPSPQLPHTGAPITATVVAGIAVAGGALILRRRFAA